MYLPVVTEVVQDIMKATPDTLRAWARIKLHPNFNTAFAEAGMPFDLVQCTPGGSEQTILAAIKGGQCKKWKRIVEAMLGEARGVCLLLLEPEGKHEQYLCKVVTTAARHVHFVLIKEHSCKYLPSALLNTVSCLSHAYCI